MDLSRSKQKQVGRLRPPGPTYRCSMFLVFCDGWTDTFCENHDHYTAGAWWVNEYKTGVINDPLGQPTVPVGNDFRLILKKLRRTDGRTDNL